jgi:hypothetical protein
MLYYVFIKKLMNGCIIPVIKTVRDDSNSDLLGVIGSIGIYDSFEDALRSCVGHDKRVFN